MKNIRLYLGLLSASVVMTGCSTTVHKASGNVDNAASFARENAPQVGSSIAPADKSQIKVHDRVYVGSKSVKNDNGDPLPAAYEKPGAIIWDRPDAVGIREIANFITKQTKIPVVVSATAVIPQEKSSSSDATSRPSMASGPIPQNFPLDQALAEIQGARASGAQPAVISSPFAAATEGAVSVNYSGPLSGLLDVVTTNFNLAWRYEGGKIVLDSVIMRSFDVPALSIATSLSFDLTSKADSDTGTSGSSAKTSSTTDVFSEIDAGIKGLVGDGTYSINKATGVITVTASPSTVNRVSSYVKGLNERLSDQVALSVKVYSVTLSDAQAFNLDIAGIFQKSGKYGINVGNALKAASAPSAGVVEGAGFGWALLNPSSDWNGSNAMVEALSTAGKVSEVRNLNQVTLNGVPVPVQVGEKRDYVRKVQTTTDSEGNLTYSIDPDTISTGFSMHLAPRIQRDGDVLLQYGLNVSELTGANDGFDRYETPDGTAVQLARVKQRNFIQQARIPNGNTLVLAGFDQVKSKDISRGSGHAKFPLFGGGRSSSVEHEIIVIAITPTVLSK